MARYNFTNFLVRNFDINIDDFDGLHRMQISGFRNYDEVLQYARILYKQEHIMRLTKKARGIIISEANLPLLGTHFSHKDYDKFYDKHFAPLKPSTLQLLTEPAEIEYEQPEKQSTQPENDDNVYGNAEDNGVVIDAAPENTVVVPEEKTTIPEEQETLPETIVPAEPEKNVEEPENTIEEPEKNVEEPATPTVTETETVKEEPSEPTVTETEVVDEEPATPTVTESEVIVEEPKKPTPTTVTKPNEPQKPEPTEPEQPETEDPDDEGIYFYDEEVIENNNPKNNNNNNNNKKVIDIEDEYYDLDGF